MNDFLIGVFLATLIIALFTTRLYRLLFWYSFNSFTLGLLALSIGEDLNDNALLISGGLTLVIKALIIPYVLKHITQKSKLERSIRPRIKIHNAIMLVPAILVFTFYLTEPITNQISNHANYVAISITALFLALLLMIEHKVVMARIVGFLVLENSLFLLGTTATNGMPMLVELGILFDLMMAIVVINLLLRNERITA